MMVLEPWHSVSRTVSDLSMGDNTLGLVVAAMSVVSSGMQQIFCRSMQQKHKLSSHELLSNTAPAQVIPCHRTPQDLSRTETIHPPPLPFSPQTRAFAGPSTDCIHLQPSASLKPMKCVCFGP